MIPGKQYMRDNEAPFINKEFSKAIMLCSKLRNILSKERREKSRQRYNKQITLCETLLKKVREVTLKELRNCILCFIRVWSVFGSVRV